MKKKKVKYKVSLDFWSKNIRDKCSRRKEVFVSKNFGQLICLDTKRECNYHNCYKVNVVKYSSKKGVDPTISCGTRKRKGLTPPPKVFKPKNYEKAEKHVRSLVTPIFSKVLQEENKTPMVGENVKDLPVVKQLWRPNNYRLEFPFIVGNFNESKRKSVNFKVVNIRDTPHPTPHNKFSSYNYKVETKNYGTQKIVKNFNGTTIMLFLPKNPKKKPKLHVIFLNEVSVDRGKSGKAWHLISARSRKDVDERIDYLKERIFLKCLSNAELFCKLFGGYIDVSKARWVEHEDELHGDDWLDKVPQEWVIHDTYFKKVYKTGIEFKSPVYLKKFITNRVVEDFAPEIVESLNKLYEGLGSKSDIIVSEQRKTNDILHTMSLQNKQFYGQFGGVVTGNMEVMKVLTNMNAEFMKMRIDIEKLKSESIFSKIIVFVKKVFSFFAGRKG